MEPQNERNQNDVFILVLPLSPTYKPGIQAI